jgi:uracil-DNA glycosylase
MSQPEELSPAELARELRRHLALYRSVGVDLMPPLPDPLPMPAPAPAPAPVPVPDSRPATPGSPAALLAELQARIGPQCDRCSLAKQGRSQVVFGVGNPEAAVMFVGEAPGRDEDRLGEPFVGAAGQLLTRIIERGMAMRRQDVYIANVIKCRPPNNRDPAPMEVVVCRPFVLEQIRIIEPKVIVTLGRVAAQALLGTRLSITKLRGNWQEIEGTPVMPTFHPAYLLRNPSGKRPVWQDVKAVMKRLQEGSG